MGKFSPSLRLMTPPMSLIQKAASLTQPQSHSRFPKKPSTKKKSSGQISGMNNQQVKSISVDSPDISDAKNMFTAMITSPNPPPVDTKFYNSFLNSFSSISTVHRDSVALFKHMTKVQPAFTPDRSTYHILLTHSCSSPDDSTLAAAHNVLNLMVNGGCIPDKVTADIAVRALCVAGREDHAIELIKELSSKHSKPDSFTYNFLIKKVCKCRDLSDVSDVINDLRSSCDLVPDLVTYTILIDNVCNRRNLREAERLLTILSHEGFKPDCFVYNTIMKGYCLLNNGSQVLGVYNKMKENGVEPDLVTYNTLVFGLSKCGRVKEARMFLDVMARMGHFPDAVTYTSLMNGMCREKNALGALALLEEMEARGCTPNSCTYNTLLHGLCKGRLLDKGIELYEVMKASSMKLESSAYGTLIRVLCKEGRIGEAYEVFDYAVESKSMKDVMAYSTLETTLKAMKKLKERNSI